MKSVWSAERQKRLQIKSVWSAETQHRLQMESVWKAETQKGKVAKSGGLTAGQFTMIALGSAMG